MFGKSSGRRLLYYGAKPYKNHHFFSQGQNFPIKKQFSAAAPLSPYFLDSASDENDKNSICINYLELDTCKVIEILYSLRQDPRLALSFFGQLKDHGFVHSVSTYVSIIRILCHWGAVRKLDSIWLELIKPSENLGFDISDVLESIIKELEGKDPSSLTLALDGLVKAYASNKKFDEAINTLFKTNRRGFLPDVKTCNFLMNQLVQNGKSGNSIAIYRQFKTLCLSPNQYTYCIVIKALCNNRDFDEADDVIFREMDDAGIKPDDYTYATYINGLCSHGMTNKGYERLKHLRGKNIKVNPFAYTALVRGFVIEKKLGEAESVLVDMDEQGLVPEACCYGELIRGYCLNGNIHKVYSLRTEMESKGVKVNCVIVSSILKCLCQIGLACEAVEQFNYYKNLGVFLDEVLYNDVVCALCELGRLEEAVELLDEMKEKRMIMDVKHYTTLMDGYFRQGRVRNALDLFKEIEEKGLKPDIVTYNVIARGLARNRPVEGVLKLLDHMEGKDIKPTSVTHNMIIEGLFIGGKVKEAEAFFKNLIDKSLDNYVAMVCGYCGAEDIRYTKAVFEVFDMVSKQGNLLKKSIRLKLLKTLCAIGEKSRALALFETLFQNNALCNIMYSNFIAAFCSCGDLKSAKWVFDTMIMAGLAPDVITYTIMINGYFRVNCLQEAYYLFVEMKNAGIKPDIFTYTVLLDGPSKTMRKRNCTQRKDISILRKEMREMEVEPDVICYTVLINRYCKSNSFDDAGLIFDEMIGRGLQPDDVAKSAFHRSELKAKKLKKLNMCH